MSIDYSNFDLITLLDNELGAGSKRGRAYFYTCPKHDDRNPSFIAYPNPKGKMVCACKAGCTDKPLDAVDFLQWRYGVTHQGALTRLTGLVADGTEKRTARKYTVEELNALVASNTQRVLNLNRKYWEPAQEYIRSRGIGAEFSKMRGFAWDPIYEGVDWYQVQSGPELGRWLSFKTPKYIIPRQVGKEVFSVNTRRNDKAANSLIERTWDDWKMKIVREDIFRMEGVDVTPHDIFNRIFLKYRKYKQNGIPTDGIYGINQLYDFEGRRATPLPTSLACVVESEFTASALQECGFLVIATKTFAKLEKAVAHVDFLYILQDNDPLKVQSDGRTFISGQKIAHNMQESAKHPHSKILTIPKDVRYKGFDDWLLADKSSTLRYLRENGIFPAGRAFIQQRLTAYNIYA